MKKLLALLLIASMLLLAFAACGGDEKDSESESVSESDSASASESESASASESESASASESESESESTSESESESTSESESESDSESTPEGPAVDEDTGYMLVKKVEKGTIVLDGLMDEAYLSSLKFVNDRYFHDKNDYNGDGYTGWQIEELKKDGTVSFTHTNKSTLWMVWDGETIYGIVEVYDDDLVTQGSEYVNKYNAKGDLNPWQNDNVEFWFCFDGFEPVEAKDVKKICMDSMNLMEKPGFAASEGSAPSYIADIQFKATYALDYDTETGWDRALVEFAIPAKADDGTPLEAGEAIFVALQIDDIKDATGKGFTYTHGGQGSYYIEETGDLGGYIGAVLAE